MGGVCCTAEPVGTQNERIGEVGNLAKNQKDAAQMGVTKKPDASAGRKQKFKKNPPIQLGYWKIRGLA